MGIGAPVFVVGNPRSGTTLFRLILTSHSQVGIAPESAFIVRLYQKYGHIRRFDAQTLARLEADLTNDPISLESHWKVKPSALMANKDEFIGLTYPEVCAQIYRNFHFVRELGTVDIWGDKNNAYGNYLDVLNHLFPTARFIHVVRDGRAVFNSYKKLKTKPEHKYAPVLPRDARTVALRWVDMVSRIERQLGRRAPGRHISVRYEDVLGDFEPTMHRVCDFLGIDYEDRMREFDQLNRTFELEPREYGWKENTFKPLDPGKTGSWRSELDPNEIETFEREAGGVLGAYGYGLVSGAEVACTSPVLRRALVKGRLKEALRSARFNALRARHMVGF